jgi:hypothetical protein
LKSLMAFPREKAGLYIIYDLFSFDNFFRLLLKDGYSHEDALMFMLSSCSFSALIFQERMHNKKYLKLSADDAINPKEAACKARVIYDMLDCVKRAHRNT